MPDLMDVLVNIGGIVPGFILMLRAITAFMGFYLFAAALIELWGASNDNAMKFIGGNQRFSANQALIQMFISTFLIGMSTGEVIGILSNTLTGGYTAGVITAGALSYTAGVNSTIAEKAQLAALALLGIMQAVGFIAMTKGWLTVNGHYRQRSHAGLSTAAGWLIGGVACWNFKWFSDALNNTIGFNLIGMFTPF